MSGKTPPTPNDGRIEFGTEAAAEGASISTPTASSHAPPSGAVAPLLGAGGSADPWRVYKGWFWAATVYNILWGTVVGLKPTLMLGWMGMSASQQNAAGPLPAILAACIGMFVGVYAIGYACVALDPPRFWPFALLGLCGKILGPMGWVLHHYLGHLPWPSLWVNVFNDLIWWPAFFGLLWTVRREYLTKRMRL